METRLRKGAGEAGATLIEALVATLVLTTGLLTVAQLIAIANATNAAARGTTAASILAAQKLEQLQALAWAVDDAGLAVSDVTTDTTVSPEAAGGGTGLQVSPASSLQRNTPGFVDHVDASGTVVGRTADPPRAAVFTRRWSITPLTGADGQALVIQVLVTRSRTRDRVDEGSGSRLPGEARLTMVRWRTGA